MKNIAVSRCDCIVNKCTVSILFIKIICKTLLNIHVLSMSFHSQDIWNHLRAKGTVFVMYCKFIQYVPCQMQQNAVAYKLRFSKYWFACHFPKLAPLFYYNRSLFLCPKLGTLDSKFWFLACFQNWLNYFLNTGFVAWTLYKIYKFVVYQKLRRAKKQINQNNKYIRS